MPAIVSEFMVGIVAGACSGFFGGCMTTNVAGWENAWSRLLPNTLLGPETTGPLFPGHCVWWEGCCCLTGFGGGVWCLICG